MELNYQASCSLDDPNWAPIVGLNWAYTYYATYAEVLHCYNQSSKIPVFMGEANYEYDKQGDEDGGSPLVLRMQEYWTMLSGASGQIYGNKYTWRFLPGWQDHLNSPGVVQFGYMENLFGARKWYDLVPDQKHTFVTAGYGRFISTGPPATPTHATICRQQLCDGGPDAGRHAGDGVPAAGRDDHRGHEQAPESHQRPLVRPHRQYLPCHCRFAVFQSAKAQIHPSGQK